MRNFVQDVINVARYDTIHVVSMRSRPSTQTFKHFKRAIKKEEAKKRRQRVHYYIGPHVYGMMYLDEAALHHVTVEGQKP